MSRNGNGNRIVFDSNCDGYDEVYVMKADGTGQTNISNNSTNDFKPAWSPNRQQIAFPSDCDDNTEIYI